MIQHKEHAPLIFQIYRDITECGAILAAVWFYFLAGEVMPPPKLTAQDFLLNALNMFDRVMQSPLDRPEQIRVGRGGSIIT